MAFAKISGFEPPSNERNDGVEHLIGVMRKFKDVNNLAREVLDKIEADRSYVAPGFCTILSQTN